MSNEALTYQQKEQIVREAMALICAHDITAQVAVTQMAIYMLNHCQDINPEQRKLWLDDLMKMAMILNTMSTVLR